MSIEKMRAEFEQYAAAKGLTLHGQDGRYLKEVQSAWMAWQASRAALVVELPKQVGLDKPFTGIPMDEMKADNSYNLALSRCRAAIEAAGVRVKP